MVESGLGTETYLNNQIVKILGREKGGGKEGGKRKEGNEQGKEEEEEEEEEENEEEKEKEFHSFTTKWRKECHLSHNFKTYVTKGGGKVAFLHARDDNVVSKNNFFENLESVKGGEREEKGERGEGEEKEEGEEEGGGKRGGKRGGKEGGKGV